MNRRTFITGSVAASALAPLLPRVAAEDAVPEERWDEASQLYGNAWDSLPKAKDGEIEALNLISLGKNDQGNSTILGLIHNNSHEEQGITDFNNKNITVPESFQLMIKPQGYAILMFSDFSASDAGDVSSKFKLTFGSAEDIKDSEIYEMNPELYDNSFPLQIDRVVLEPKKNLTVSLSNPGETDAEGALPIGLIMTFDDHGIPTDAKELRTYGRRLTSGPTWDDSTMMSASDIDGTAPYLIAYRAQLE